MLKVKVRTVKEGEFEVQVEPTETVIMRWLQN